MVEIINLREIQKFENFKILTKNSQKYSIRPILVEFISSTSNGRNSKFDQIRSNLTDLNLKKNSTICCPTFQSHFTSAMLFNIYQSLQDITKTKKMAGLSFWFCLTLLSRIPDPFSSTRKHALMENAREIIRINLQN